MFEVGDLVQVIADPAARRYKGMIGKLGVVTNIDCKGQCAGVDVQGYGKVGILTRKLRIICVFYGHKLGKFYG